MVEKIKSEQKEYYQCMECGLKYEDKEWAEKCEVWCRKNKSCNLEITAHAVNKEIVVM